MFQESYENGAGRTAAGEKDKIRGGRDAYQKDMYDMMPKFEARKVTTEPNTGIKGSAGSSDSVDGPKKGKGNTQNGMQKMAVKNNDGSKDYGKGNPYQKNKDKKITSIDGLRAKAKEMGV